MPPEPGMDTNACAWWRGRLFLILLLLLLGLTGCAGPGAKRRPPEPPSWPEAVRRHNHQIEGIETLWARAVVEIAWRDETGDHREQGEGHFILARERKAGGAWRGALTVGKLGRVMFWAGFDRERDWLFDLRRKEARRLHVGRRGPMHAPDARGRPALPVTPDRLVHLAGLERIDPEAAGHLAWDRARKAWRLDPESDAGKRGGWRYWIDPATGRLVEVAWRDAAGEPVVRARLRRHERLETPGLAPGAWPVLPTRIEVISERREAALKLTLGAPTGDPERVREKVFDLEALREMLGPVEVERMEGGRD